MDSGGVDPRVRSYPEVEGSEFQVRAGRPFFEEWRGRALTSDQRAR